MPPGSCSTPTATHHGHQQRRRQAQGGHQRAPGQQALRRSGRGPLGPGETIGHASIQLAGERLAGKRALGAHLRDQVLQRLHSLRAALAAQGGVEGVQLALGDGVERTFTT